MQCKIVVLVRLSYKAVDLSRIPRTTGVDGTEYEALCLCHTFAADQYHRPYSYRAGSLLSIHTERLLDKDHCTDSRLPEQALPMSGGIGTIKVVKTCQMTHNYYICCGIEHTQYYQVLRLSP